MTEAASASIEPFGDAAVLVSLGRSVDPVLASRAQAIAAALETLRRIAPAVGRAVPAHASVLVPFDPLSLTLEDAIAAVRSAIDAAAGPPSEDHRRAGSIADPIEIPVRYGGADGPDLDEVAGLTGLQPADVVELHASARYHVLFLGFAPGFGYLGGLPEALLAPRRPTPRERVPAGSVAIAGRQTGVYPLAMPGGWQLIGRTDTILFDPARPEPALLRPGATVRFVPVRDR